MGFHILVSWKQMGNFAKLETGADPGFWSGGPAEFWPQGGGLSPKLLKIGVSPLKLPENCWFWKKKNNFGGKAGPAPPELDVLVRKLAEAGVVTPRSCRRRRLLSPQTDLPSVGCRGSARARLCAVGTYGWRSQVQPTAAQPLPSPPSHLQEMGEEFWNFGYCEKLVVFARARVCVCSIFDGAGWPSIHNTMHFSAKKGLGVEDPSSRVGLDLEFSIKTSPWIQEKIRASLSSWS